MEVNCGTSTATSTEAMLELAFLKRLRGEKRFESVAALIDQMARDVQAARVICA